MWVSTLLPGLRVNPHLAGKKGTKKSGNVGVLISLGENRELKGCAENLSVCALQRPARSCD